MDICFGVFYIFIIMINCVKVLNSMLKDCVCQGLLCAGLNSGQNPVHLPGRNHAGIFFYFTAGIFLLHSFFLSRILPVFLLICIFHIKFHTESCWTPVGNFKL